LPSATNFLANAEKLIARIINDKAKILFMADEFKFK
jgi:hypothetical protein